LSVGIEGAVPGHEVLLTVEDLSEREAGSRAGEREAVRVLVRGRFPGDTELLAMLGLDDDTPVVT
jgi:hypothetical protein